MSGLFGGSNTVNDTTPPASSLRVQTSVAGKPRAIVCGQTRVPPNLIDAVDFSSETSGGGGGGKGLGGGTCVAGEMLVEAPGGAKRLDAIVPGDVIWELDPATGMRVEGRVQDVLKHPMKDAAETMLRVRFVGRPGDLHITSNHYPWVDGVERREMKDWKAGEALIHWDGAPAVIGAIDPAPDIDFTYNLIVEPHHNFFAGGVLLHNGFGGGGGKGSSTTNYFVSPVLGLCEGPIPGVIQMWNGSTPQDLASLNLTVYGGTYPGEPDGTMETTHPERALGYAGLAYLAGNQMPLGTSANMPNLNAEVIGPTNNAVAGLPDADPAAWFTDLASNANYGVGFPSAHIGDLTSYSVFCKANSLVVSDAMTDQRALSDYYNDLAEGTYSEFIYVDGKLTLAPRGMQPVAGNGYSYTPDATKVWPAASIDDFLPNVNATGTSSSSSTLNNDPVIWVPKRRSDLNNQVTVNCFDRGNGYNPNPQIAQNLAAIEDYGLRSDDPKAYSFFAVAAAALTSAHYQLEEAQQDKTCCITLGMKYAEIAPMDILPGVPLPANVGTTSIRITEITQNSDFTFSISAEPVPGATVAPQVYNTENPNPMDLGVNADPGPALPVIFEPPESLSGDPEVWIMANGASDDWSGCEVWLSFDNATYSKIGTITNPARAGVLTATLPTIAAASFGATVDNTNTLAVALFGRNAELDGATQADALRLATASYVDGEIIAYQDATLTAPDTYALTGLVRGAYGTTIGQHLAGTQFARIDDNAPTIVKMAYTPDHVGEVCYLKLVSFNLFGAGGAELASVPYHVYVIQGAAVTVPLPDVTGLQQTVDVNNVVNIIYVAVTDTLPVPRPIDYEIRFGGATPQAATFIGRTADTKFAVPSDGVFWVAAHYSPVDGIDVYSADWASITVTIPIGLRNLLGQVLVEAAPVGIPDNAPFTPPLAPWWAPTAGYVSASIIAWRGGAVDGSDTLPGPFYTQQFPNGDQPPSTYVTDGVARLPGTYIALDDSGDFLALTDVLGAPNVLYIGGIEPSGRFIISGPAGGPMAGVFADSTIIIVTSFDFIGAPIYGDFLSLSDVLAVDDVLQWSMAQRAILAFQYSLGVDLVPDPDDDSVWTTFQAGQQIRVPAGQNVWVAVLLKTDDPNVQPILTHLLAGVFGVDQVDRFQGVATGTVVNLATGRNAQPNIALMPLDQASGDVVTVNWQQAGIGGGTNHAVFGGGGFDRFAYTGFEILVTNGGVGVTRHFDCTVIGF